MREHRHGLAFGWLIIMVMTLALFALTYALLLGPAGRLLDVGTQQTSSSTIASGRDMARAAWEWAPLAVLGAAALALIARAIFESAQPGR